MQVSAIKRLLSVKNPTLVSRIFKSNASWSLIKSEVSTGGRDTFHSLRKIGFHNYGDREGYSNSTSAKKFSGSLFSDLARRKLCSNVIKDSHSQFLLPPIRPQDQHKKCLVVDLDETLINCSEWDTGKADFIFQMIYERKDYNIYVHKRPYVDEYLQRMGELFECVLFTASVSEYANPIIDWLDPRGVFKRRLFRESCTINEGLYVKDLSRLGRDLRKVVIIDNSPEAFKFHPKNAVQVQSWYADSLDSSDDSVLLDLIPFFERLSKVDDVYSILPIHLCDM